MLKSNSEIGKLIYNYRISKNLSQKDVADALDVTLSAISNWERGQARPSLVLSEKLARMMELSLDEFLVFDQNQKNILYPLFSVITESTFTLEVISVEIIRDHFKLRFALSGLNLSEFLIKKATKIHLGSQPNHHLTVTDFQKTSHRFNHDLFMISITLDKIEENDFLVFEFNEKEIRFELNKALLEMIALAPLLNEEKNNREFDIYKSKIFEHYIKFLIKNNNHNMILNHILYLVKQLKS